jgi:hypothetical protein
MEKEDSTVPYHQQAQPLVLVFVTQRTLNALPSYKQSSQEKHTELELQV